MPMEEKASNSIK